MKNYRELSTEVKQQRYVEAVYTLPVTTSATGVNSSHTA